ncbi:protein CHAPERONE-LIKE PROTEIN OF POR1, chloroplastic [Syzygium oleosum]|uniref:protein CHAPERONE-LIKE PROTEIN OF POR1, chloroplastic n=1 Tax=Syzygium oleosum TaxID=219896 RepID=UPI0024B8F9B3|nr:protein CHAPERONE-LIKE PROTEIN OF POR1, chloroplastic [Syzygium oleosum]
MAATALSVRPNRLPPGSPLPAAPARLPAPPPPHRRPRRPVGAGGVGGSPAAPPPRRRRRGRAGGLLAARAGSRADDSAPFEMSVESALKLLGVPDTASFDEILRAKNSIVASCKDDKEAVAQVEAAYDMLLMQSLTQRRAGKVVSSSIRYADVKPIGTPTMGSMPQWLQTTVKNSPLSVETPSTRDLGLQVGVYGALIVLTYVNGASTLSVAPYAGADVPGLILASSFGASLYFMTRKNIKLGKATIITIGGLVAGAVVGSAVESWLQVDIVPFLGIHSPAALISEFILFSQLFASLYLR